MFLENHLRYRKLVLYLCGAVFHAMHVQNMRIITQQNPHQPTSSLTLFFPIPGQTLFLVLAVLLLTKGQSQKLAERGKK